MSLGTIGDYELKRELGQGGMGKVYLAASRDGAEVALKTIIFPDGLTARARWEAVERFQREARAARSLEHPNICQVRDIGADGDTFFIVMEYLDGQSVGEEIEASGALGVERSVQVMLEVCGSLAYAHDQGIIHRDIKPDNIMLLRNGQAKLMDFGLAAIVHETGVTQTGTMMGTFSYMSPEQARGEKVDARSDIFSLGVTLYEMLTGRQAFGGEASGAVINDILNKELEPVTGLPPVVSRTLNRCLRKKPEYRFGNVREIISNLQTLGIAPTAGGQAAVQGTMVQPARADDAKAVSPPPPASPASSSPAAASSPAAPKRRPPTSGVKRPHMRCGKCGERMAENTPSCWKCGTPNPALAQRKSRAESQVAIREALAGYKPPKKRGWFRRR